MYAKDAIEFANYIRVNGDSTDIKHDLKPQYALNVKHMVMGIMRLSSNHKLLCPIDSISQLRRIHTVLKANKNVASLMKNSIGESQISYKSLTLRADYLISNLSQNRKDKLELFPSLSTDGFTIDTLTKTITDMIVLLATTNITSLKQFEQFCPDTYRHLINAEAVKWVKAGEFLGLICSITTVLIFVHDAKDGVVEQIKDDINTEVKELYQEAVLKVVSQGHGDAYKAVLGLC